MMNKGYAAIIIQNSSGSGRAERLQQKNIVKTYTYWQASKCQSIFSLANQACNTNIYVFKANEKHHKDDIVKFVDFTNDGYSVEQTAKRRALT
jgi:hypothetical protein